MQVRFLSRVLTGCLFTVVLGFGCGDDDSNHDSGSGGHATGQGGHNGASGGSGGDGQSGSGAADSMGGANVNAAGAADAGAATNAGAGAGAGGESSLPTHDQQLQGLGFDTNLGPPQNPAGAPLPATYNPLRKKFATFHPRAELYVAGIKWTGNTTADKAEILFDDKTGVTPYQKLPFKSPVDDTWTSAHYKNAIAADLDGDGLDEIFIAYYVPNTSNLEYIVIDPGDGSFSVGTIDESAPDPTTPIAFQEWAQPALAKGDFDGSGHDQIAVGFGGLYIVNIGANGPSSASISKRSLDDPKGAYKADVAPVFVAAGDLDGDANDELVASFSSGKMSEGRARIYDGTRIARDERLSFTDPDQDWKLRTAQQAQVAVGNVDADHLDEVVFFGRTQDNWWQVFVMDDLYNAPPPAIPWKSFHHNVGQSGDIPHPFALLDFDGDGVKEAFAQYQVVKFNTDTKTSAGVSTTLNTNVFDGRIGDPFGRPRVAVGDIDADGKDDVVVEADYRVRVWGLNALQDVVEKQQWSHPDIATGGYTSVIMAAANVDKDSPVVEFDGDHELLFTDPNIVAVVSAPPYVDGIGQDVKSTTSTFGVTEGTSRQTQQDVGLSVGFSVGTKEKFLFGEAESKVEVEASLDFSSYDSHEIKKSLSYTTAGGSDLVVFSTIPFDVYYYTIRSSPTPAEVGTKLTINIPRVPQTIAADPDFFNEHSGPNGVKVDASVLGHTLGDPSSYPSPADRDLILMNPGSAAGKLATVTESGTATSTLQITDKQGAGTSMALDVTFSWEVSGVEGPSVGGSVGYHYGYSYTVETSEETLYQGVVGAIPAKQFAKNLYSYGILAYPQNIGQQKFVRLDYWVE